MLINWIKENKCVFAFFVFVNISVVLNVLLRTETDFYHMAVSGKWIVEHRSIQYQNDQFILDGYDTVIQQWLYCVLIYMSAQIGKVGTVIFTYLQYILFCFTSYKLLKIHNKNKAVCIMCLEVMVFIVMGYINCRPHILSLILLETHMIIVEKYRKTGKKVVLCILPFLTLCEINVHGTYWIFHFLFILPYLVPIKKLLRMDIKIVDDNMKIKSFIVPFFLMALTLLVNPYGTSMITCLFKSGNIKFLEIDELQKVDIMSGQFLLIVLLCVFALFIYRRKKLKSTTFYMLLGTILMSLYAIRNFEFLIFPFVYLINNINEDGCIEGVCIGMNNMKMRVSLKIALVSLFIVVLLINFYMNMQHTIFDNTKYAVKYLQENETDMSGLKVYSDFNSGAYFLWNGVGKVYMQAKTEPYLQGVNHKKDVVTEYAYIDNFADKEGLENFLELYDFDYLYVPYNQTGLLLYLQMSSDYECVAEGNYGEVYNKYNVRSSCLFKKVH